jgi:hypothetical protein
MKEVWIQTVSGKRVDLPIPKPEQIDINDIAYALAMKCRFNGQCKKFYSVAEHSVRVSCLLPNELALAGLLHDANEAYLPDIPRPVKELIPDYKRVENLMEEAINKKYGVLTTEEDKRIIKRADNVMLATEARDLMGDTTDWGLTEIPLKRPIKPWTIDEARWMFLEGFTAYTKGGCHV